MVKRTVIGALCLIWVIAVGSMALQLLKGEESDIVSAFSNNDFPSVSSSVESVAELGNVYLSDEDRKELAVNIAWQLGINNIYELDEGREDSRVEVMLIKETPNVTTKIKVITIEEKKNDIELRQYQYIIVTLDFHNSVEYALVYRDKLEALIGKLGTIPEITVNLGGRVKGELNLEARNKLVDKLLDNIDGKIVVENRKEELYSVYGYTEKVSDFINIEGEKININIGVNYDEQSDMTNVFLSIPIINFDY